MAHIRTTRLTCDRYALSHQLQLRNLRCRKLFMPGYGMIYANRPDIY